MTFIATDPLADMLTRIRNAVAVNKRAAQMPHSKLKQAVAAQLKEHKFISDYKVVSDGAFKQLKLILRRADNPSPIIGLKTVSKPGRRRYVKQTEIPTVRRGHGLVIISTSKGVMSGREAKRQGLGGELLCIVW